MRGGGDGLEAGMRTLSLTGFTLITWNEGGWTREELGSLSLTTEAYMYHCGLVSLGLRAKPSEQGSSWELLASFSRLSSCRLLMI